MANRHTTIDTPLGELTLVADGHELVGVYFPHHWHRPKQDTFGPRVDPAADAVFTEARHQLADYLAGRRSDFDLPVRLDGEPAQRRVWHKLAGIGYGDTVTYGELAATLADGTTARDIGQVVGRNPLSIVIPCHRVVGRDGRLTGYAGGLSRKRLLLELEEPADARAARLF
jgi:methylated-DNA-[protein]-cysteine S-methyltransferase